MIYWVLMLSRVGEAAGIPMAVYTRETECKAEIVVHEEPAETYWRCLAVLMPES